MATVENDGQSASPGKRERYAYEHPETCRFIFAEENTWAANAQRVKTAEYGIGFSPKVYDYFDGVIARKLKLKPLTDKKHPDYGRYQALRDNIALLRNYVLTQYEDKGLFESGMEAQMRRLGSMAAELGDALAKDKLSSGAMGKFSSVDLANIDGVGACEMYKHLLDHMERPTAPDAVVNLFRDLKAFLNVPDYDWRLPELADSPFSPEALAAPPPGYVPKQQDKPEGNTGDDTDLRQQSQGESQQKQDDIMQSVQNCENLVQQANQLYSIDTLAEEPRAESIEEARKILRLLRNMEFVDRNTEQFLGSGTQAAVASKKQALGKLVDIFSMHARHATRNNPALRNDPAVDQARESAVTIALELTEHTRRQLITEEERYLQRHEEKIFYEMEDRLNHLIDSLPAEADFRILQSLSRLLDSLEMGLERVSGQEVEKTGLDRLSQAALRTHAWALQLYEEKLEEYTREESLEYAREIMHRLQQLIPEGITLEEFAQQATLPQKIAFAAQVEELVEAYRNIMSEAFQRNPDLVFDEEVRQANDAIGGFASAVKLMASKEIPNSIAAAQQISADITQEPGQWKDLHHRAVDRLIKSAEGGLEKAIGEIAQDDDEEQAEDVAQELMEASVQDDRRKRKKRRRGETKSRSGKGGKKQRRKQMDLSADDRILKQGVFAEFGEDFEKRESKDMAKAQARKAEREQNRRVEAVQADDYLLGQGRFSEERSGSNAGRESRGSNNSSGNPNSRQNRNQRNNETSRNQRSNDPMRASGGGSQRSSDGVGGSGGNSPRSPATIALSAKDMAAIQQLGDSLRGLGSQIQGAAGPGAMPDGMKQNSPDPQKRNKDNGPKI